MAPRFFAALRMTSRPTLQTSCFPPPGPRSGGVFSPLSSLPLFHVIQSSLAIWERAGESTFCQSPGILGKTLVIGRDNAGYQGYNPAELKPIGEWTILFPYPQPQKRPHHWLCLRILSSPVHRQPIGTCRLSSPPMASRSA